MTVVSAIFLLFIIMDPIGNVPLFLSILKNIAPERRRKIIIRELLIALLVLLIFMFSGKYILAFLQISESSLGIAGGIMLLTISFKMIFPGKGDVYSHNEEAEPLIVPLAVPLLAGPSAIAAVILMMAQEPTRWMDWSLALVVAWLLAGVILISSETLGRKLGVRALIAIERLMGILLLLVSVNMLVEGIKRSFNI